MRTLLKIFTVCCLLLGIPGILLAKTYNPKDYMSAEDALRMASGVLKQRSLPYNPNEYMSAEDALNEAAQVLQRQPARQPTPNVYVEPSYDSRSSVPPAYQTYPHGWSPPYPYPSPGYSQRRSYYVEVWPQQSPAQNTLPPLSFVPDIEAYNRAKLAQREQARIQQELAEKEAKVTAQVHETRRSSAETQQIAAVIVPLPGNSQNTETETRMEGYDGKTTGLTPEQAYALEREKLQIYREKVARDQAFRQDLTELSFKTIGSLIATFALLYVVRWAFKKTP